MTEITSRLSSALADRYRIERHLGEGGMATVYLAEDLKHKRKVAVKVLRPELAAVLGAERFVQEITTTANLQHPHILPLFDSGEADGFLYYVMPFIDGETLRDKLNRETQLGVQEAVSITTDIADALDYAHRNNVIHRDIKPENILLHDDRPMVADFGIALAVSAAAGGRMTETGLSLGTPHYMSPEQATAEKDLTNRSDIYSLGCALYEMLTGSPPHVGSTAQQIIMKIVTEDAQPVTQLRKSVPPHVAAAIQTALSKLPADRFTSAARFAEALSDQRYAAPLTEVDLRAGEASPQRRRASAFVWPAAAAVLAAVALWGWLRPSAAPEVARFTIALPDEQLVFGGVGPNVVLAPDGSGFVYVGPAEQATRMLFSRSMTQLEAFPIPGSDNGLAPFFSPDGASVGFLTFQGLHTISLGGGPPVMLTDSAIASGGSWGDDGMVYFTNRYTRGISRVSATGGAVETVTIPDSAQGEVGHRWVDVLPASKGAIFMILRGALDEADIGIVNFATGEVKVAVRGTFARYASSGHIVYTRSDGALLVAPFDADAVELTGPSTPILEGLVVGPGGDAQFTVSRSGHLIYQTGDLRSTEQIVWLDRSGVEQVVAMEQRDYDFPRLSPDGLRVALTVGAQGGGGGDIFVYRFEPPTLSRLTFEGLNNYPTWSHDGRRILFTSDREAPRFIYQKAADGSGSAELVYAAGFDLWEGLTSPDERWLIVRDNVGGERTIHYLELGSDTALREFGLREFQERSPVLSPDGQWIAYTSDESGRDEIYVRPFPPDLGGKWQVSSGGGTEPAWAHSGRELFYRSGGTLMAVDVQTTPTFTVGTRTTLFEVRGYNGSPHRTSYTVDRTDQRFLFVKGGEGSRELVVVLNWFEEVQSRVGG